MFVHQVVSSPACVFFFFGVRIMLEMNFNYLILWVIFLVILARKVSIMGLLTEWGDRIFQSIIVRGKNENL